MGYNTNFTLGVSGNDYLSEAIVEDLRQNYDYAFTALDEDGGWGDTVTWYDHEENLRDFSIRYPKRLFTLKGWGAENEDIWIKYFKAGKMLVRKARIIFDGFDEDELE